MPTPHSSTTRPADFRAEFERALQRLRGALTELYAGAGADPANPQKVSRELGINRNLAWKLGKIVHATDVRLAYPHLPGPGAYEKLLAAFKRAGASAAAVREVHDARSAFETVVERHAGDRATLELMVGNLNGGDDVTLSETSRKLAFQGNSAIWGAQARARSLTQIVAPNRDEPRLLDNAMIGGVFDYRRLRPGVRWPLGQRVIQLEQGQAEGAWVEPIDPDAGGGDELPLMRAFCPADVPPLRAVREGDWTITELLDGPVGNLGSISCVFGWIHRRYSPVYREAGEDYSEHALRLDTPVEVAVFDLLLHRDLPYELPPRFCLYSVMHGRLQNPLCTHTRHHLPCSETVEELGFGPPTISTPHVPRYTEMVRVGCERLGRPLEEFHGFRLTMHYPPIPTIADLYVELPDPPE